MIVKKAVITAAGRRQRTLPLQTLIDRNGAEKSVLSILIEEVLAAGIDEIAVVVWPGDEQAYAQWRAIMCAGLSLFISLNRWGTGTPSTVRGIL